MRRRFRHGKIGIGVNPRFSRAGGKAKPSPTGPWFKFSFPAKAWQATLISGF